MEVAILMICVLVTIFNTALLLALCGAVTKLIETNKAGEQSPAKPVVSDTPVPRSPNYSDFVINEKPSDDLKIIKDE